MKEPARVRELFSSSREAGAKEFRKNTFEN